MYKVLLCWRYLLTRYLALACIISVMLGVATLIVVNSVMSGFSTKLKDRLHGLLSDVIIESFDFDGYADPEEKMRFIRESSIGDKIEAMAPTIEVLGLIQFNYAGRPITPRAVRIMGINPKDRAQLGGFKQYLLNPRNQQEPSFELSPEAKRWYALHQQHAATLPEFRPQVRPGQLPPPDVPPLETREPTGIFLGYSIGNYRDRKARAEDTKKDVAVLQTGDAVVLHTMSGAKLTAVYQEAVVADFFKSEMSEYDANFVFVPLDWLQNLRSMPNRATHLQIRLKDYNKDAKEVVKVLGAMFPHELNYHVETWEDKQGPLLSAIAIEKGILNILLFLIIGVAGFGILAIFAMIVVEKTRDIGILKALGASNGGVMKIFLGYGLLLGVVGAILGTVLGLTLTVNINDIEQWLGRHTGREIFDRSVYYFDKIPTDIQAWMVVLVNTGAIGIAVLFSVLPALRAALLHPVRALRYE
jgi:lipoprotein-releasing system permease protein